MTTSQAYITKGCLYLSKYFLSLMHTPILLLFAHAYYAYMHEQITKEFP